MGIFGNKTQEQKEEVETITCDKCESEYVEKESTAKDKNTYCSIECENEKNCKECDETYDLKDSNDSSNKEEFCSKECEDNYNESHTQKYTLTISTKEIINDEQENNEITFENLNEDEGKKIITNITNDIKSKEIITTIECLKTIENSDGDNIKVTYITVLRTDNIAQIELEAVEE